MLTSRRPIEHKPAIQRTMIADILIIVSAQKSDSSSRLTRRLQKYPLITLSLYVLRRLRPPIKARRRHIAITYDYLTRRSENCKGGFPCVCPASRPEAVEPAKKQIISAFECWSAGFHFSRLPRPGRMGIMGIMRYMGCVARLANMSSASPTGSAAQTKRRK